MATITYTNVAIDNVIAGVEKLLETEFTNQAAVYVARDYMQMGNKAIRLQIAGSEPVTRVSGAVTRSYTVQITIYLEGGQRADRIIEEELNEISHRVQRVLEENNSYSLSTVYKWHDGLIGTINNLPDLTDKEAAILDLEVIRILYSVTATEVGSAL